MKYFNSIILLAIALSYSMRSVAQENPTSDESFYLGKNENNDFNHKQMREEAREKIKLIEKRYNCTILCYPYEHDEVTGLKMLYIKTNECPYNVANGVDNIILTNDKNEIVYVVHALLRHDRELNDDGEVYGLYVVGKDTEGEIEISDLDRINLERLLFQHKSIDFLNCTKIKFHVSAVPHLIPFSPICKTNKEKYQRFFGN